MEDLSANSEGSASPSTGAEMAAVATDASGAGATGQQGAEQSGDRQQSAAEPQQEGISAGWSFDDQGQPESTIPENDEIPPELLNDPNLDQAKVPGLVEKLRGAWAEAKQHRQQVNQLREQIAKLEQYGGPEGAGEYAGLVNGLIGKPSEGAAPFMATLAQKSLPAYQGIADTLVQYEAEYLVSALQAAGKLPEAQQQTAALTPEDWARIPKELHDVAKQIPVNELLNWLDNGNDQTLQMMLSTQKELSEMKGAQRQQAEKEWRTAVQQAETQAQQSIQELSNQYQKAHIAQLSKWQPFGPQAEKENQRLYSAVMEGALAEMLQDKQWQEVYQDTVNKLQNAPLRRLKNEHMAADVDERTAREAAMRFNTRLGQVMKDMISHPEHGLNSVFRDARQWREYQRQSAPERKEIPGNSSTASNGHSNGVPALDENGNISEGFMQRLTERMRGWKG
jgi:hypothetical protein